MTTNKIFDIFRERFNALIEARHVMLKDVAEAIQVTRPTISRYRSGERNPDLVYVVRLADYFGVTVDWLLGREKVTLE